MKITRIVAIALMAGVMGSTMNVVAATAQIKQTQPAEFPSSAYKGKQYVDSKGCVFIRAGIDGNVSWVPRVTRSRKVVCGFTPTGGTRAAAAAPAQTADKPIQITVFAPAPKPTVRVAQPKPQRAIKPVVVRQTAPKPVVVRKPVAKVAKAPAPAPTKRVTRRTTRQVATACPGASAISQRYLRGDGKSAVRCGPQTAPIVGTTYRTTSAAPQSTTTVRRTASTAPTTIVGDHTRIVPKHVAIRRLNTTNVSVPKGYRQVWDDGRLNPKRAEQSLSGRSQMLLIWTNTVPRRLVNQATGRDLTASVPLVYPYLDDATQLRELGEVTIVQRNGQVVKRIVRHNNATTTKRKPVYSSRSAPNVEAASAPQVRATVKPAHSVAGKRFVHIGLFSTKAKAQRAAQHLAGMGMRARMSNVRYKGKTYLSVQAGPFNGANATQGAVTQLRGAGYSGAKVRN